MFSRLLFSLFVAMVTLGNFADLLHGSEPPLADLLPRAKRVLIATAQETADLREAGSVTVSIDRALRGRGRKEETVVVDHDGALSTVLFDEGQQYLILLQPSLDDAAGWTYVGSSVLPYKSGEVVLPVEEDQPADTVLLTDLIGLVDRYPSSPDAMIANRTSLNGRWVAMVSIQGRDIPFWVLDIRDQDGKVSAEVVDFNNQNQSVHVESIAVTDGILTLRVVVLPVNSSFEHTYVFTGRLRDGKVIGNFIADKNAARPGKLRATAAKAMAQTGGVKPSLGLNEFSQSTIAEDEFAANKQFTKDFPESPLAMDTFMRMLKSETGRGLKEEEIDALAKSYIDNAEYWGELMRRQAVVDAGVSIAEQKKHPQLALKYLLEAEAFLSDTSPQTWTILVPFHAALMYQEMGELDEASQRMNAFHKLHPFEPLGAYYAAEMLESRGEFAGALQIYSELACLPNMKQSLDQTFEGQPGYTPVTKKLQELWDKHSSDAGDQAAFVGHILKAYHNGIRSFVSDQMEPRPPKPGTQNRVVLLEFFTTADAPLGVGIDVAVTGLTHAFGPSELVALRYHLPTEEPDPMAGPQCKERLNYYNSRVVPLMYIDGKQVNVEPGRLTHAATIYKYLRELVEPILVETVDIELKLNTTVEEDRMKIDVQALSASEFEDDIRLRLVLVEEEVAVETPSGVLLHENLVRIMPGGAEGIAPQDGKLAFQTELLLEDYRQQLLDELQSYEEMRSNLLGEEFKYGIYPIGPVRLKLAAFVQNNKTKEVLQSAIVDLKFLDEIEEPAKEEKPDDEAKPAEEPKPAAADATQEQE
ncbi:hypothetical protein CA54_03240 [Symmachiella macrocystis]|uniref:Tetratricopeptide repeat protein n=1 Tax=Symmachiella macrocystis TaxID=2527985 RepID=A0A5C6BIK5_9PLAN|nr:hypothetical protein [Symmachiella macrocystis]TWU11517.1 hypothetical protein CA54_03240 [Symmachiella macrocystis]